MYKNGTGPIEGATKTKIQEQREATWNGVLPTDNNDFTVTPKGVEPFYGRKSKAGIQVDPDELKNPRAYAAEKGRPYAKKDEAPVVTPPPAIDEKEEEEEEEEEETEE
jgi:hypothetical protein